MTEEPEEERSRLSDMAASIADAAEPFISGARRLIDERPGARVRRVRRMSREPLVNLWEAHPEAYRAAIRERGVQTIPVSEIAGTAVEGPPQRAGDFLPLRDRRGADWRARWQRILKALDELAPLPPIEVLKLGEEYWVVDGHNRVAAALYNGQPEIDAVIGELRIPGTPAQTPTPIAGVLEGSRDLRDAGAGRLTPTFDRPNERQRIRTEDSTREGDDR